MTVQKSSLDSPCILRVPGDLLSTNAEALRKEFEVHKASPENASEFWKSLTLDLTAAKMIDSVGLNLIVTILKEVKSRGGSMQVIYSSPNIHRTFVFTRLDTRVKMVKAEGD